MIVGLWHSAAGGLVQDARVDVIAHNMSNANTPGFRREYLTFQQRRPEPYEDLPDNGHLNPILDALGSGIFLSRTQWDRTSGALDPTDRRLDMAIEGDGFFTVRREGQVYLTRAGNFAIDAQSRLVTADGKGFVLGEGGEEIVLPAGDRFAIGSDGTLLADGEEFARLGVVGVNDPDLLRRAGDAGFELGRGAAVTEFSGSVHQGLLEGSSVQPVREMVSMIEAMRAYEANLQMIRNQDATLDRAVNEVGRPAR